MKQLVAALAILLAGNSYANQESSAGEKQVFSPQGTVGPVYLMADGTGGFKLVALSATLDGNGTPALVVKMNDAVTISGEAGSAGIVTTVTATRFMSGVAGAATSTVLPTGTNWAVMRSLPLGLGDTAVGATIYAVANTMAGQVDGGTGAPIGVNTPVVWDNLDVGPVGVTIYFGSVLAGGAVPVSVEAGQ